LHICNYPDQWALFPIKNGFIYFIQLCDYDNMHYLAFVLSDYLGCRGCPTLHISPSSSCMSLNNLYPFQYILGKPQ
jgi:hypothetical protein